MGKKKDSDKETTPGHAMALNAFAAACLDSAQKELTGTGSVRTVVSFGYNLDCTSGGDPSISLFAFTRQGTDEEEKEIKEVTHYARATSAEAVAISMDLANDPEALAFFSGSDGILLVAAVSTGGSVGIMRPYRRSGDQIAFGDPRITDNFSMPLLEDIFDRSSQAE